MLTEEQVADIKAREAEAVAYLKDKQFNIAAYVSKQNIGDDLFADKVVCYLQDTKYNVTPKKTS